ncbi:ribulose-phosphate 3-epimerase [Nanoarchaeota archaeon]
MTQKILPSIMAKSQKELDGDLKKLKGIVKTVHLDVVDGKFAPNKTFQFPFKLKKGFDYNVHLMIKNPEKWINKNGKKVDTILFHPEVVEKEKIESLINKIKSMKKKAGFALKPETKVKTIKSFLDKLDYVLILTVHPGFYGSRFLKSKLRKIKQVKRLNKKVKVIVDGGMCPNVIGKAAKAGADFFVSGSYTTKADNPKQSIKNLMKAIK